MISVRFQDKPLNMTVIQIYGPNTDAKKDEVYWFYEDLQQLLELTPKNDALDIIENWNAKVGNQEILRITGKLGFGVQNEARQRLTEFCQENMLAIENTMFQQPKRQLYIWISLHDQYRNQIYYILCRQRWRSSM